MTRTLSELAEYLNARLEGDGNTVIKGVAGLENGGPGHLVFAENNKNLSLAEKSGASAVILPLESPGVRKPVLRVEKPRLAFARAAELFAPDRLEGKGIHSTAVIAADVEIGSGAVIHPHVVVEEGVKIGENVKIGAGVFIGRNCVLGPETRIYPGAKVLANTEIGRSCLIQSGAVLGSEGFGFVQDENGHLRMPQLGKVLIEDEVEIGANTVIDRGALGPTVVGAGSKIDSQVIISHNVCLGKECLVVSQSGIAGSSILGNRVRLGGQVGITDHVRVGDDIMIGAKSGVSKDILETGTYFGIPAMPARKAFRIQAGLRNFDKLREQLKELEEKLKVLEEGKKD